MECDYAPSLEQTPSLTAETFLDCPTALRRTLEWQGALRFVPGRGSLFPASNLAPEMGEATGMNMAWLRDNALIANALYETGRDALAVPAGRALLAVLNKNRGVLDDIVCKRRDPSNPHHRLPVRVAGDTLKRDEEPRVQNDSVGYTLWLTSRLIEGGAIKPDRESLRTLSQTVRYLDRIEYWHDADDGHWEEDRRIHVSSIGVAVAGLRAAQSMLAKAGHRPGIDINQLVARGQEAMQTILAHGLTDVQSMHELGAATAEQIEPLPGIIDAPDIVHNFFKNFTVHRRAHDAALLFLVEPLQSVDDELAQSIVQDVEQHLTRSIGIIRYQGDTYWEPRFKDIMPIDARTTAAEGRTEWRNLKAAGVAYSMTEAQWTLFDPLLSKYWGERYRRSQGRDHTAREKQLHYLNRSLGQLTTQSGRLLLPEAYYYEYTPGTGNQWIPNDHTPLLMAQAGLLLALKTFEETTSTH